MDFRYVNNCFIKSTIYNLVLYKLVYLEKYCIKLLTTTNKKNVMNIYFENSIEKCYFVLEYNYKFHTYKIYRSTQFRNKCILLSNQSISNLVQNELLEKIFTADYINKKLISFEEFQVAGHFLLNKIIHAYHNPDRVLCNIRMERQYNEFWNGMNIQ